MHTEAKLEMVTFKRTMVFNKIFPHTDIVPILTDSSRAHAYLKR